MDIRHVCGERVRRRRMELGMSQTDFAATVGIPVPRLSSIEHGHQSIYIERLAELAQALRVSSDYLLGLTDDPAPRPRTRRKRATPAPDEASEQAGSWEKVGVRHG